MSKKTNREKQSKRKRKNLKPRVHFRHPRGVKGKKTKIPNITDPAMLNSCVDLALGMAFAELLRATGLRDKLIEIVLRPLSEEELTLTVNSDPPDLRKGREGAE